jgi:hypothetical protein
MILILTAHQLRREVLGTPAGELRTTDFRIDQDIEREAKLILYVESLDRVHVMKSIYTEIPFGPVSLEKALTLIPSHVRPA